MAAEVLGDPASFAERWRFCVAPMMDWTDRHCRYLHRQLSSRARLYTEMVTTGTLLHGDAERHLRFDAAEHPVALQLGGSEPDELVRAAKMGEQAGYDEINLNCGCPSERVQHGAFGACLMAEPHLVATCIRAMQDAVAIPVTVKHRIGIDRSEDYGPVRDFVGTLHDAGCHVFIVHARNAWLRGLSPKENREVPPLRYEIVHRLKRDFAAAVFVLNGGLQSLDDALTHARGLDGAMLGRAVYHDPFMLTEVDARCYQDARPRVTREGIVERMSRYLEREYAAGTAPRHVVRHMLGLFQGLRGARNWRRLLSDAVFLDSAGAGALRLAVATFAEPRLRGRAAA
ncbi:MAG TPA: tRNA dihydrouridine(20/20a) synthase DusA [Burkholderiaceae bacterium]|nr:tRNA dihydrouridine(20/20a) synthase DusA [Burkholderiaceae bacterium]